MSVALAGTVDSGTPGCPATNRRTCPSCRVATAARSACRRSSAGVSPARSSSATPSRAVLELLGGRRGAAAAQRRGGERLHPVHDDARERHPLALEPVDEVGRLAQGVALGRRDDDEGRARAP